MDRRVEIGRSGTPDEQGGLFRQLALDSPGVVVRGTVRGPFCEGKKVEVPWCRSCRDRVAERPPVENGEGEVKGPSVV